MSFAINGQLRNRVFESWRLSHDPGPQRSAAPLPAPVRTAAEDAVDYLHMRAAALRNHLIQSGGRLYVLAGGAGPGLCVCEVAAGEAGAAPSVVRLAGEGRAQPPQRGEWSRRDAAYNPGMGALQPLSLAKAFERAHLQSGSAAARKRGPLVALPPPPSLSPACPPCHARPPAPCRPATRASRGPRHAPRRGHPGRVPGAAARARARAGSRRRRRRGRRAAPAARVSGQG